MQWVSTDPRLTDSSALIDTYIFHHSLSVIWMRKILYPPSPINSQKYYLERVNARLTKSPSESEAPRGGHFIPPVFIYGRKRMKAELLDTAPPGSVGMVSDSSFINSDLYLDCLAYLKYRAKPTRTAYSTYLRQLRVTLHIQSCRILPRVHSIV